MRHQLRSTDKSPEFIAFGIHHAFESAYGGMPEPIYTAQILIIVTQ